jgi:hypothetical protein
MSDGKTLSDADLEEIRGIVRKEVRLAIADVLKIVAQKALQLHEQKKQDTGE